MSKLFGIGVVQCVYHCIYVHMSMFVKDFSNSVIILQCAGQNNDVLYSRNYMAILFWNFLYKMKVGLECVFIFEKKSLCLLIIVFLLPIQKD